MKNKILSSMVIFIMFTIVIFTSCAVQLPEDVGSEITVPDVEEGDVNDIERCIFLPSIPTFHSTEEFMEYIKNEDPKRPLHTISEEAYLPLDEILNDLEIEYIRLSGENRYYISLAGMDENSRGGSMYVTYNPVNRDKSIYEIYNEEIKEFSEKGYDVLILNDMFINELNSKNTRSLNSLADGKYKYSQDSYDVIYGMYKGELVECQFKAGDYIIDFSGLQYYPEDAPELVMALRDSKLTVELIKSIEGIIAESSVVGKFKD